MSVVPAREDRFLLRMVWRVWMGRIEGVVLFPFTMPIFIGTGLGSRLRGLGITGMAIRPVSCRHSPVLTLPVNNTCTVRSRQHQSPEDFVTHADFYSTIPLYIERKTIDGAWSENR